VRQGRGLKRGSKKEAHGTRLIAASLGPKRRGVYDVFDGCYCKTSSSFAVCNKRDKCQANTVVTQRGIPLLINC